MRDVTSGHIDLTKQEEMGIFLEHETKWLTLVVSVTSLENDPIAGLMPSFFFKC